MSKTRRSIALPGWDAYAGSDAPRNAAVLHREPFRLSWIATQMVTFAFVIDYTPDDYDELLRDYDDFRKFASRHKKTFLPIGFQCGYCLLPIYVGHGFSQLLIGSIRSKRHYRSLSCTVFQPSLFDVQSHLLHTQELSYGIVYRRFVSETITQIAEKLSHERYAA